MIAETFNQFIEASFASFGGSGSAVAPAGLLILGLITGLRHSLEADHVATLSTLVATRKSELGHAPLIGLFWGLGHTATLFVAGLIVLLLSISIPEKVSGMLEFGVGIMLVFLGVTAITGFKAGKLVRGMFGRHMHDHAHIHDNTGLIHSHTHGHHDHRHGHKALIIGMIHGMAGSGALMLVVLSTVDAVPLGLGYIAIFGAGSIASMVLMSTIVSLPFAKARHLKTRLLLRYVAAAITLAIGAGMIYELGIIERVFF